MITRLFRLERDLAKRELFDEVGENNLTNFRNPGLYRYPLRLLYCQSRRLL